MWNRAETEITLVIIRHGATKANQEHRYLGKTDEPLSKDGERTLKAYAKKAYYPKPELLFTSPMKRCMQTAELIYRELLPIPLTEWTETDFGVFEGKNYEELKYEPSYQAWIDSGGTIPFPGGESREAFVLRCKRGFEKMLDVLKTEKDVRTVGVIVHGGTMMALLSEYYGGDYFSYQTSNGKGYICKMVLEEGNPIPSQKRLDSQRHARRDGQTVILYGLRELKEGTGKK